MKLEDFLKDNIGILKTQEKFIKASERVNAYTSDYRMNWTVEVYSHGYYYIAEGTRTKAAQYVDCLGTCTRKPKNIRPLEIYNFYDI